MASRLRHAPSRFTLGALVALGSTLAIGIDNGSNAAAGDAACLLLASHPDGAPLARIALPAADPAFSVTYVHSVTRTPVVERYRADGDAIVQTEIRFVQHGPGLPTEADAGGAFTRRDGEFVVSMRRRFAVDRDARARGPGAAARGRRPFRGPGRVGQPCARGAGVGRRLRRALKVTR